MNELQKIAKRTNLEIGELSMRAYLGEVDYVDREIEKIIMKACTEYALSKLPEYTSEEKWAGAINSCIAEIALSIKKDITFN